MSDRLTEVLGTQPPPGVEQLADGARAELAELIGSARRQQADDLAAAFAAVIKTVPFPVRPIARRILGA